MKAKWVEWPYRKKRCFNLLLAPWPLKVHPKDFKSITPAEAGLRDMPKKFGFFGYEPPLNVDKHPLKLRKMLKNAEMIVDEIHGVVFPELALTSEQYKRIKTTLMRRGIFLICGVRKPPTSSGKAGKNYLQFDIPVGRAPTKPIEQNKHHRWRLDKRQIVQYGLGSCLDVDRNWWEHISIKGREINFVVLDDWLTVCALICEDLARQDPVSEIVRAVGPNLVIALLMDGPQLASRWPARYATVLADDPGSSVLTLTSVGMSELSRPPSNPTSSRAIALWKDAKTGDAISIELPPNKDGAILSLSCELETEWSADGRNDGGTTGYPTLSGIHFVDST